MSNNYPANRFHIRAWNAHHKYMVGGDGDAGYPQELLEELLEYGETSCYIKMHSIGKPDKHGKEIFEGDIVRCEFLEQEVYVVQWDDDGCCFELAPLRSEGADGVNGDWCVPNCWEVIGNIYENKDLLKV